MVPDVDRSLPETAPQVIKRIKSIFNGFGAPRLPVQSEAFDAGQVDSGNGLTEAELNDILSAVKPFTMVHESGVRFGMQQVLQAVERNVPGVIVECGVWRGGCSLAMLLAQRKKFGRVVRPVYMLDSFQGLPPVTTRDGPLARHWQEGADPPNFFENCTASKDDLQNVLDAHGFAQSEYKIFSGWFSDTLPNVVSLLKTQAIALLRLDSDWYDSTLDCLNHLMPLVSKEAVVIVDDYYAWDGCARAVHDFLSRSDSSYRIRSLYNCYGAYFVKRPFRENFDVL